jgi:hypothetical protein
VAIKNEHPEKLTALGRKKKKENKIKQQHSTTHNRASRNPGAGEE